MSYMACYKAMPPFTTKYKLYESFQHGTVNLEATVRLWGTVKYCVVIAAEVLQGEVNYDTIW